MNRIINCTLTVVSGSVDINYLYELIKQNSVLGVDWAKKIIDFDLKEFKRIQEKEFTVKYQNIIFELIQKSLSEDGNIMVQIYLPKLHIEFNIFKKYCS